MTKLEILRNAEPLSNRSRNAISIQTAQLEQLGLITMINELIRQTELQHRYLHTFLGKVFKYRTARTPHDAALFEGH